MTAVVTAPTPQPAGWQARLPFFYGWVIVAIGFMTAFMNVALVWAVGVFAVPMIDELGWSRSAIFGAINVRSYMAIFMSPLLGRFFDTEHGGRVLTLIAGAGICASVLPIAWVKQEWQFFLLFGVLGGLSSAAQGGQIVGAIVPKWFIRKRGSAMAWATMGSAASAFVVPPLVAVLIDWLTWRPTWAVLAVMAFIVACVPAVLLRRQPEDVGLLPDGDRTPRPGDAPRPQPAPEVSFSLRQAARTPVFYLLAIAVAVGSLSNTGLPVSLVTIYADKGLSRELAVAGFSIYGLFSVIGRFFWGYLVNRYHIRWVLLGVAVMGALTTPLFLVLNGPVALVCAACAGLTIGGQIGFAQMVWPVYFGRSHLGSITGVTRPATSLVMGSGSGMMAASSDITGSYAGGLWAITASWVLAGVGMLLCRPPRGPALARPAGERAAGAATEG